MSWGEPYRFHLFLDCSLFHGFSLFLMKLFIGLRNFIEMPCDFYYLLLSGFLWCMFHLGLISHSSMNLVWHLKQAAALCCYDLSEHVYVSYFDLLLQFKSLNMCLLHGHKSTLKSFVVTDTLAASRFGLPSKPYREQQLHSHVRMALYPEHKKCLTK